MAGGHREGDPGGDVQIEKAAPDLRVPGVHLYAQVLSKNGRHLSHAICGRSQHSSAARHCLWWPRFQMGNFMSKELRLSEIRDFCLATAGEKKPIVMDE